MDTEFQMSLLCYLVQSPHGENYIDGLNEDTFSRSEFKIASQIIKRYYKIYNKIPGNLAAKSFLETEISRTPDLPEAIAKELREVFEDMYIPLGAKDSEYVEDQLVLSIQDRQIEVLTSKYAKGDIEPKEFLDKLGTVSSLALPGEDDIYKGSGFIIADKDKYLDDQVEGHPTFLQDLNKLTSAGGFYSPQLVYFMSGPKYFKTGILIKLGVEYMRWGMNVYYADGENGIRSIRNRVKQTIMECELRDLYDQEVKTDLDWNLSTITTLGGGDLFIDSYPANMKSIKDVSNRLDYLKEKHGFVPGMIIWDEPGHFLPSKAEDQRRDLRIKSQLVTHEIIALNKRIECFSFASAQVNRAAIDKKVFSMKDIAEDFAKVMNAHAIFAICATDPEMEEGIRRILPVVQREGVGYKGKNQCIIMVDESKAIVQEAENEAAINVNDD